jgi:hypothetical protein
MKLRKGGFGWNLPYLLNVWSPKSIFCHLVNPKFQITPRLHNYI